MDRHVFEHLVGNSSEFMGFFDPLFSPLYLNRAGLSMVGLDSLDELQELDISAFFFVEDHPFVLGHFLPKVVRDARGEMEIRLRHFRTGAGLLLRHFFSALTNLDGVLLGYAVVSHSVTRAGWDKEALLEALGPPAYLDSAERSHAKEEALKLGARRNAFLSEAAGQLLQVEDPQTVIETLCRKAMNDLSCQFFFNFLVDEQTNGLRLNAFAGLSEEEARQFESLDYRTARRGCLICQCGGACAAQDLRKQLASAHGLTAYCCYPLLTQGQVIGMLSFGSRTRGAFTESEVETIETLSHFVSIAIARSRMERTLRECLRHKDEFIAMLAHELRNPLAAICNGFQAIARTGGAAAPALRPIVGRQLKQLTRLVDDLLETGRIATGKIEIKKEILDLRGVVEQSIEASEFCLGSYKVTTSISADSLFVKGDPARLIQVVANLIDNATKYTPDGGRIDVTALRISAEAVVSVRDNGVGIPEDRLDSIFEMFEQVDPFRERSNGGLGIGLNLARRIAEKHGGRLEAKSEGLGRGSTFSLRLPLLRERNAESERRLKWEG